MHGVGLDHCEICVRNYIKAAPMGVQSWPGPKDQQNKTDVFLSAYGVM